MSIIIQTQTKFCFCLTRTNISFFFSDAPKHPLTPKVGPLPNIRKSILR